MRSRSGVRREATRLTTETVQSATLSLQSVDDIERGDGLALGVLGVGDSVTDDALEERLEDTARLFVDHCEGSSQQHVSRPEEGGTRTSRDTLDTATTSETSDGWLRDTLDVVAQDLSVTLSTALAEALAALSTCNDKSVSCCKVDSEIWCCSDSVVVVVLCCAARL